MSTSSAVRRGALALGFGLLAVWALRGVGGGANVEVGTTVGDVRAELDDGRVYQLGRDTDQVLVLNFWASWCGPCRKEAPILSRLRADDVEVIGVSIEDLPLSTLSQRARAIGVRYPIALDRTGLVSRFRVDVVPTTYVIAADGEVIFGQSGVVGESELRDAISRARPRH